MRLYWPHLHRARARRKVNILVGALMPVAQGIQGMQHLRKPSGLQIREWLCKFSNTTEKIIRVLLMSDITFCTKQKCFQLPSVHNIVGEWIMTTQSTNSSGANKRKRVVEILSIELKSGSKQANRAKFVWNISIWIVLLNDITGISFYPYV